jgi:hypothetical protein
MSAMNNAHHPNLPLLLIKSRFAFVVRLTCLLFTITPILHSQNRVETREALTHVVKRVEPVLPQEAVAARVGGTVYADVIIRADGTVESVEILAGAEMLRATVANAIKQWTFRPFLENGKAARIITLIEIPFVDPAREEEKRIYEGYRTSEYQCRRQMESEPKTSISPCQSVVEFSKQLPQERQLERSSALTLLGEAFFINQLYRDALTQLELALATRQKKSGLNDEGTASLFEMVGITHFALGDFAKADETMAASVRSYEGAIQQLPTFAASYTPRLQTTLRHYADMKKAAGDLAGAEALMKKADAMRLPAPPPLPSVSEARTMDGIRLIGPAVSLTEEDLKKIRALMPSGAPPIWLIIGQPVGMYRPLSWDVQVYLDPDSTSPALRTGRLITLSTQLPAADALSASKTWTQRLVTGKWAHLPLPGRDVRDVQNEKDRNRPVELVEFGGGPKFEDREISRVLAFVRSKAASTPAASERPRLATDIQPWPVASLSKWSSVEIEAYLLNPATRGGQSVRIKLSGDEISVSEMR